MMIGDIVVALQPEGGLPAPGQTTSRRKHLNVAVWPDPSYRSCLLTELRDVFPAHGVSCPSANAPGQRRKNSLGAVCPVLLGAVAAKSGHTAFNATTRLSSLLLLEASHGSSWASPHPP